MASQVKATLLTVPEGDLNFLPGKGPHDGLPPLEWEFTQSPTMCDLDFVALVAKHLIGHSPLVQSLSLAKMNGVDLLGDTAGCILSKLLSTVLQMIPWREWKDKDCKDGLLHMFGVNPQKQRNVVRAVQRCSRMEEPFLLPDGKTEIRPIGEQYMWSIVLTVAFVEKEVAEALQRQAVIAEMEEEMKAEASPPDEKSSTTDAVTSPPQGETEVSNNHALLESSKISLSVYF